MERPMGIKRAKKGKGNAYEAAVEVKEHLNALVDTSMMEPWAKEAHVRAVTVLSDQLWGTSSDDDDDEDYVDPADLFSMDDYISRQNHFNSIASLVASNIKTLLHPSLSRRRSGPKRYVRRDREGGHARI
ncbi:hypothetical protein E2562_021802 [Oryza meyeriana var. granulata]|uniref:Uncharacterized protein n=1 Tax=Oryza meyeriana var. granulata TaxID=110450 RepID=A0A6G1EN77_9ORYZ|nr:hypothetical protein E2562_021802 [Oryza meyeriana var. granulata]